MCKLNLLYKNFYARFAHSRQLLRIPFIRLCVRDQKRDQITDINGQPYAKIFANLFIINYDVLLITFIFSDNMLTQEMILKYEKEKPSPFGDSEADHKDLVAYLIVKIHLENGCRPGVIRGMTHEEIVVARKKAANVYDLVSVPVSICI